MANFEVSQINAIFYSLQNHSLLEQGQLGTER